MNTYDVVIIGAGSAGLTARREVEKVTDNYLICDPGILGTTCARVGCMPSKVLIQVAHDFSRRHKYQEEGIHLEGEIKINSKDVMMHVRKLRDRFVRATVSGMPKWENKFKAKKVSFLSNDLLLIGEEKITAKKVIIATGGSPFIPKEFMGFERFCVTTDEFFEMDELPNSIAVVGTGVIGMELGEALSKLDIDTLIVGRRRNICSITDSELNEYVCHKMEQKLNINFSGIESVLEQDGKLLLHLKDGTTKKVEKVLVAAGRKQNLSALNLKNTSAKLNERGTPVFNKKTMRIENTNIYIAGDITGEKAILHEASDEGRVAGFNACRDIDTEFKFRTPLAIAFTEPNIAFVGKTFKELKESNIHFETGVSSFEGQGRSIIKLTEEGMLRLYGEKKTGKILGAELYAPDGEHLAHLISWAIESSLTANELLSYPFYHPVVEEGLRTAIRDLASKVDEKRPELEIYKA